MSQKPNHICGYCGTPMAKNENPYERKCGHFDSAVIVQLSATVSGKAKIAA